MLLPKLENIWSMPEVEAIMIIWQKLKTCLKSPLVVAWFLRRAHVYLGLTFGEAVPWLVFM